MDDLGDFVGDAVAGLAGGAADAVGPALYFLPGWAVRWILTAVGVALGAYLLLGDGSIDGGTRDLVGAAFIIGSPFLLILVPRWWHNI